jgi:hypothetical protein
MIIAEGALLSKHRFMLGSASFQESWNHRAYTSVFYNIRMNNA